MDAHLFKLYLNVLNNDHNLHLITKPKRKIVTLLVTGQLCDTNQTKIKTSVSLVIYVFMKKKEKKKQGCTKVWDFQRRRKRKYNDGSYQSFSVKTKRLKTQSLCVFMNPQCSEKKQMYNFKKFFWIQIQQLTSRFEIQRVLIYLLSKHQFYDLIKQKRLGFVSQNKTIKLKLRKPILGATVIKVYTSIFNVTEDNGRFCSLYTELLRWNFE